MDTNAYNKIERAYNLWRSAQREYEEKQKNANGFLSKLYKWALIASFILILLLTCRAR